MHTEDITTTNPTTVLSTIKTKRVKRILRVKREKEKKRKRKKWVSGSSAWGIVDAVKVLLQMSL